MSKRWPTDEEAVTPSVLELLANAPPPERWFVNHVGTSMACVCSLIDGPEKACDIGESLFRVAHQSPWEERQKAWAKARGLLSPWG